MNNINEYQLLSHRTVKDMSEREQLINGALGLVGETGEVVDLLKKHLYQNHALTVEKLKNELGDVMWYIVLIATKSGLAMSDILQENIDKLRARYPDGFNSECSINRKDWVMKFWLLCF